jgi:hypothetical protein
VGGGAPPCERQTWSPVTCHPVSGGLCVFFVFCDVSKGIQNMIQNEEKKSWPDEEKNKKWQTNDDWGTS